MVRTPTLQGLGERAAEAAPEVGVADHAADITAAVHEAPGQVTLVAHSYSGAPVEVAAPAVADRLERIVHVDSYALADGEAVTDFLPPPVIDAVRTQAATTGEGWQVDPRPPELLGLTDPADIEAVVPRLTRQSLRTVEDRVHIEPGADAIPRTYVECLRDADRKVFGRFAARSRDLGWQTRTLATGHEAMITDPNGLAALLLAEHQ